jgi:hypothetical protein
MSHTKMTTLGLVSAFAVGSVLSFQPLSPTTTLTPQSSLLLPTTTTTSNTIAPISYSSSSKVTMRTTRTTTTTTTTTTRTARTTTTALQVAVDPTVITKKEYQDICGVSFDHETLDQRLTRTNFLYPKHVEVIEEIGPIAGAMVHEIVRFFLFFLNFIVIVVVSLLLVVVSSLLL